MTTKSGIIIYRVFQETLAKIYSVTNNTVSHIFGGFSKADEIRYLLSYYFSRSTNKYVRLESNGVAVSFMTVEI